MGKKNVPLNTTKKLQPAFKEAKRVEKTPQKGIPVYIFILSLAGISITYFMLLAFSKSVNNTNLAADNVKDDITSFQLTRDNHFDLIRPILFAENNNEDENLESIKVKLNDFIAQKKNDGTLTSASVYLEKMNGENCTEINAGELYDPASLMKVSLMIIYLKKAEENPRLLDKQFFYKKHHDEAFIATIKSRTLTLGEKYTVKELLEYMIKYSDNQSFYLLSDSIHGDDVRDLYSNLNIPVQFDNQFRGSHLPAFVISAKCYARFFKVLFNSSYLSAPMSQYALTLLTQSDYTNGMVKGIDANVKVAHKFGERTEGNIAELHEFGIVYIKNNPYLLGVMTKGASIQQLSGIISDMSKMVYDRIE